MDHLSAERRSWLMSRIRSKDTSPELRVRRLAHRLGLRFRLHRKDLPGSPDLTFPRHRVIILVHGCFWHRHAGCRRATSPKSRIEYWEAKFQRTIDRDRETVDALETLGWKVVIIWECETVRENELAARLENIFKLDRRTGSPRSV